MKLYLWGSAASLSLALASIVAGCSGTATGLGAGGSPGTCQSAGATCPGGQSIQACVTKDASGNCATAYFAVGGQTFNCASCVDTSACLLSATQACEGDASVSANGSGSGGSSGGSGGGSGSGSGSSSGGGSASSSGSGSGSGGGSGGGSGSSSGSGSGSGSSSGGGSGSSSGSSSGSGSGSSSGGSGPVCPTPLASVPSSDVPPFVTPVQKLGSCAPSDIAAFVTACSSATATQATCQAWFTASANATCVACIEPTSNGAPTNAGATLTDAAGSTFNVAGCIALTDKTNGTACAQALTPLQECADAACTDCASSTAANMQQCSATADGSGGACASYLASAQSVCTADYADGGAGNTCQDPTYIVNLYCGTGG